MLGEAHKLYEPNLQEEIQIRDMSILCKIQPYKRSFIKPNFPYINVHGYEEEETDLEK